MGPDVLEGPKVASVDAMAKVYFGDNVSVREQSFLPLNSGGTSFMGLVSRLYGERPHPTFEGIKTKRYLYHIYANKKPAGIAHASSFVYGASKVDVLVVYNTDGSIKSLQLFGAPESVTKELTAGNYLGQFEGRYTEDFEVVRGKRGKIRSRGAFIQSHKRPLGAMTREYFDRTLKSVRFNAAFMDVAYFITKHPDLDRESQRVIAEAQSEGPEAFVKDRLTGESRMPAANSKNKESN